MWARPSNTRIIIIIHTSYGIIIISFYKLYFLHTHTHTHTHTHILHATNVHVVCVELTRLYVLTSRQEAPIAATV